MFSMTMRLVLRAISIPSASDVKDWDFATETLKEAVTEMGKTYVINEGDGAFYGPKLDFHISDCLGRTWQCAR